MVGFQTEFSNQCIIRTKQVRAHRLLIHLMSDIMQQRQVASKGGAKRHRKILRENIKGITKGAIRRLARRSGVKRVNSLIYEETRAHLKLFLTSVLRDAVTYSEHARRKTLTPLDVVFSLKRQGRALYGFGG